jgi:hypothetical protein
MSVARHANLQPLPSATQGTFAWDPLRVTAFTAHLLIVAYVSIGWLASTRTGLLFYLLLLPMIVMQWLLNAGASILDNAETLIRTGHWHDSRNIFEGHFFQNILCMAGIRISSALINLIVCATLLLFWIEAFYRMIMIPTTP